MKRLLFLILAIVVAGSTVDYGRSAGHLGAVVVAGVVVSLLLIAKAVE
ncbi:hypothetical protein [Nocardia sp. CDC160]|nr:hypothetical protein [Nocardia sp. CDC160]MEC3918484.1 hypothetical protein [Nocardia sp. CDC160]